MVLVALALVLAMLKLDSQGVVIILICAIGALTAMSWLDTWVLVLVGVLAAALFARALISGGGIHAPGWWSKD